jgi:subtilisin family serine protease
MYTVRYGGKNGTRQKLAVSDEFLAVRTANRASLTSPRPFETAAVSPKAQDVLGEFELEVRFRQAGVEILRARQPRGRRALRDRARATLKKEPEIEFAGRVLVDPQSNRPIIYTENLFIKFEDDTKPTEHKKVLKRYRLVVKRPIEYTRNAYFVEAPEGIGLELFAVSDKLLAEPSVELCHPELIREARQRAAFPQQWHLRKATIGGHAIDAHAAVEAAWALSDGTGAIIAVIDDGIDIDHEEFRSSGKIVAPRDVTRRMDDPRPGNGDDHGTACAGVACAAGAFGASGVAPGARLIPIRLASALGSQAEADAFVWAAQHGADVISCSWGPADGHFENPNDPRHNQVVPLPDSTRLAMDYAVTKGRNSKGCVICFAAGNGNESVDNDGYASYANVIAVAASNDVGKKAAYSDFGKAIWCAFPSNHGRPSITPGIWTTDRSGSLGYNPGQAQMGDANGNYTNDFGGTSSACPGAAGVAALVIARNPALRWDEVRDVLKRSCDKIDTAGAKYDSTGRSPLYGFGRLNAKKAVELARPAQPKPVSIRTILQDVPIRDLSTARLALPVGETDALKALKVSVDIEHTYIGDLVVTLQPPTGAGAQPIVLHNRQGGTTDNIKRTYDEISTPALGALKGKAPTGTWTLAVADKDRLDTGKIRRFTLEMQL